MDGYKDFELAVLHAIDDTNVQVRNYCHRLFDICPLYFLWRRLSSSQI